MNHWSCSPLPAFHSDLCWTFGRFSGRGQNLARLSSRHSSSLLIAETWLMSADEMNSVILCLISEVKFWFSINPLHKGQRSVWESKLHPGDWSGTSLRDASWEYSSFPGLWNNQTTLLLLFCYWLWNNERRTFLSQSSWTVCVLFSCNRLTLLIRIRIIGSPGVSDGFEDLVHPVLIVSRWCCCTSLRAWNVLRVFFNGTSVLETDSWVLLHTFIASIRCIYTTAAGLLVFLNVGQLFTVFSARMCKKIPHVSYHF